MKKFNFLALLFIFGFIGFTFLSWIILFRDRWDLEIIGTKFYPGWENTLYQIRDLLLRFKLNTLPSVLFLGIIILLFVTYFILLKKEIPVKKIIFLSIACQIIAFFSYPVLSSDVLSYILSDRLAVVYHRNVWLTKPNEYQQDPFFHLADWTDQTRIYGGVNQFIYNLPTLLSGNDLLVNIAVHKLVVLVFSLGTMYLVYQILKNHFPDLLSKGMTVFFLNPLFIIESVGSGHNDILMLFFVILSYFFYLGNRFLFAGLALGLSTQVKSTSLLLAVFLVGYFLFRRRIKDLLVFTLSYGAVVLLIYFLMGVDLTAMVTRTTGSTSVYWQSLPLIVNKLFPQAKPVLTLLLLIFLVVQGLRLINSKSNPLEIYGQTLLVYLMFFLNAYWNWYPIWILALLPFLYNSAFKNYALAFTFSSMLTYPVYWLSLRLNYQHPLWAVIIYMVMIGGPLSYLLYGRFIKKVPA